MTDQAQDASSPQATRERAKQGEEILGARIARGEPGTKQPAHDDSRLSASKTVEVVNKMAKQFEAETMKSSDERAKATGNPHPIAPEDRLPTRGPAILAAAGTAAAALGQARDAITLQLESDAQLTSDPRYERDQKVFEMGQRGKLGLVTPSETELAVQSGDQAAAKITPEEQVADDMSRLEDAERRDTAGAANVARTQIEAGKQDMADKNNGRTAQLEGKTGAEAVARAKEGEASAPAAPKPNVIK